MSVELGDVIGRALPLGATLAEAGRRAHHRPPRGLHHLRPDQVGAERRHLGVLQHLRRADPGRQDRHQAGAGPGRELDGVRRRADLHASRCATRSSPTARRSPPRTRRSACCASATTRARCGATASRSSTRAEATDDRTLVRQAEARRPRRSWPPWRLPSASVISKKGFETIGPEKPTPRSRSPPAPSSSRSGAAATGSSWRRTRISGRRTGSGSTASSGSRCPTTTPAC